MNRKEGGFRSYLLVHRYRKSITNMSFPKPRFFNPSSIWWEKDSAPSSVFNNMTKSRLQQRHENTCECNAVQDFHNLCVPSFLIHTLPFFLSRMKAFVNFLYGNSSLQLVSSLENNLRVIWLISIPSGASGNSFALLSVMFGRLLMIVLREEIYNQSNDLIKHAAQHEHTEIGVIRTWLF